MREELKPISVVGASAGTGKTYRLASDFALEVDMSAQRAACAIIATTFTNKAADELAERIRRMLLTAGKWEDAQAVLAGYVGTVNSICGRLVSELVIDAGLSPSVNVIAEERQAEVFNIAVESVTNSYSSDLWAVSNRLSKEDWRDDVRKVAELARQNNITPEQLRSFTQDSWRRYEKLFPGGGAESATLTGMLHSSLVRAIGSIEQLGDTAKTTAEALETLREADRELSIAQELPWRAWAKLSKLRTAKASQGAITSILDIARRHIGHPRLRADIQMLTESVFNCATDCLALYQEFKAQHGLIDFIDQEQIALSILQNPSARRALNGRFQKLFVDEFQDTSPIQLAVFLELARIVRSSTWVGDEKQSIFGFRGADPELMQEVVGKVIPLTGGTRDSLTTSYRSRPSLVRFVNTVFGHSSPPVGVHGDSIQITNVDRSELPGLNEPVHVWWLNGTDWEQALAGLAAGVRDLLENGNKWPVSARGSNSTRPIRGSDIAILCRTNKRRLDLAAALAKTGLTVATQRSGLLDTPECLLVAAVLRYLIDPFDTLAAAEILKLTSEQAAWFSQWIENGYDRVRQNADCLIEIDGLRTELIGMTPVEAVELASAIPLVVDTIKGWGGIRQRFLNLDALRGLAISYEELCLTRRGAATPAGLVAFLYTEATDPVQPANPDEDAIQVLTYHKAKGLEWPLVIMFDLDSPPPATPFGTFVESASEGLDPLEPLNGRTIRYWPWPYGQQRANLDLADAAGHTSEMASAQRMHAGENPRLLYVGMTRPRDYLIFACRPTTSGAGWLNMVQDSKGRPTFTLPGEEAIGPILTADDQITACFKILMPSNGMENRVSASQEKLYGYRERQSALEPLLSYNSTPSSKHTIFSGEIESRVYLGGRLPFSESMDIRLLGDALHRFLAIDDLQSGVEMRIENAMRTAERWGVSVLAPEHFLEASNRIRRKLSALYPGATFLTEWPVAGRIAGQRLKGTIDLLLELPDRFVIVDHKSFPGAHELWEEKAVRHFSQLFVYSQLVQQATGKEVKDLYIHMPIVGMLLKLLPSRP